MLSNPSFQQLSPLTRVPRGFEKEKEKPKKSVRTCTRGLALFKESCAISAASIYETVSQFKHRPSKKGLPEKDEALQSQAQEAGCFCLK